MKMFFSMVLPAFLWTSAAIGSDYRGFRSYLMNCESVKNRHQICEFRKPAIGAKIQQKISDAYCNAAESWGYSSQYLWVSQGCAAQFIVYEDNPEDNYSHMICGSNKYEIGKCRANSQINLESVELVVQLSGARCIENRSWGVEKDEWSGADYIWVAEGCEAIFSYSAAIESEKILEIMTRNGNSSDG